MWTDLKSFYFQFDSIYLFVLTFNLYTKNAYRECPQKKQFLVYFLKSIQDIDTNDA